MPGKIGTIKIRIPRVVKKGDVIPVKALIIHPMETGLRKDKNTGERIPAHYINEVTVFYGDTLVTRFDWSFAVSANPLITFHLKVDKAAPLRIIWKDNRGGVYEKTVQIKPD